MTATFGFANEDTAALWRSDVLSDGWTAEWEFREVTFPNMVRELGRALARMVEPVVTFWPPPTDPIYSPLGPVTPPNGSINQHRGVNDRGGPVSDRYLVEYSEHAREGTGWDLHAETDDPRCAVELERELAARPGIETRIRVAGR